MSSAARAPWTHLAAPMSPSNPAEPCPLPLLTETQATLALQHAASLIRSAFCILHEATFTSPIDRVEETGGGNGVLRMHQKELPHSLLTFENCKLPMGPTGLSAQDRQSVLCYLMCGDAPAYMHGVVKLLLGWFCKDFQTLKFSPLPGAMSRTMTMVNSAKEVSDNRHVSHEVLSVVLLHQPTSANTFTSTHTSTNIHSPRNAQPSTHTSLAATRYIIDITGPQYGWFAPAMKYDTYHRNHVLRWIDGHGTGPYVKHTPYLHECRGMWDEPWRYQIIEWVDERLVARLDLQKDEGLLLPETVFLGQGADGMRAREEFLKVFKELVYEGVRKFGDVGQAWHRSLSERRFTFGPE